MEESLNQKIRDLICKIFNHFPRNQWYYAGTHANCACCKKVITKEIDGTWV